MYESVPTTYTHFFLYSCILIRSEVTVLQLNLPLTVIDVYMYIPSKKRTKSVVVFVCIVSIILCGIHVTSERVDGFTGSTNEEIMRGRKVKERKNARESIKAGP